MAQITHSPPFSLHLTDCEFLFIFHLFHEIEESLEGRINRRRKIHSSPELTFDADYGIFDTYCCLLKKIDTQIMKDTKEAG